MSESPDSKARAGERSLDVAAALREAKLRGLPDGWTVSIDVSGGGPVSSPHSTAVVRIRRDTTLIKLFLHRRLTHSLFLHHTETKSPQMDGSQRAIL